MINRVRSAQGFAALLLLAAACGDSGGGSDDEKDTGVSQDAQVDGDVDTDGDTPEDDGGPVEEDADVSEDGGGGEIDAGGGDLDATVTADATLDADTTDTGVTTDTGTVDAGGGTDAGVDAGPTLPANCAETTVVAGTGATITSTDTRFSLTLGAAALSGDSTVRVCVIAAASAPPNVTGDGSRGDVYLITTTPDATFSTATATFRGHSAFPGPDSDLPFDPVRVRTMPASGSAASGANNLLSLRKAATGSASTLTATIGGPGHVYVATLEAPDVYQVDIASPKTAYVTGEVIDLSAVVAVSGTVVGTRTLDAEYLGCDVEIMNNPTPAHTIGQTESTRAGCSHFWTVERSDRTALPAFPNIEGSAALTSGNSVDFSVNTNSPPRFFCKHPGTGWAAARLLFKNGSATDLTVEKRLDVTCTYSGDWITIHDQVDILRTGSDLTVGTVFTAGASAAISPPAITYTAFPTDGVLFTEPAAILSTAGPANFQAAARYMTGPDASPVPNPTNTVTFNYAIDRYAPSYSNGTTGFFGFRDRAALQVDANGDILDCYPAPASVLQLDISDAAGASTTVSTLDGTLDLISIRGRFTGTTTTVVQHWVDASKLTSGQDVPLLTPAQQLAVAGLGTLSEYQVGLYKVTWDEERKITPGGRVLPIACGTVLVFQAADIN